MRRTVALTTAVALSAMFGWNPNSSAANVVATIDLTTAELLLEEHFSEQGFEVDLFVTRAADGSILSEASVFDPTTPDQVDV